MAYYNEESLQKMKAAYQAVGNKLDHLVELFALHRFKNARAREHANHGYARRLRIMVRCMDNVFIGVPPETTHPPSRDQLSDATINIQSFVFNVFGCVDNLAWLWVAEKGQKRADGTPIPDGHIGLGPNNESVRATLSEPLRTHLVTLNTWFEHMSTLRHALAHRIPLYIPPYVLAESDIPAYRDIETRMSTAIKQHDFDEYDRLSVEQLGLGKFRPWIQHSFEEKAKPVIFHAQMIADFNTVEELGRKMLEDLN